MRSVLVPTLLASASALSGSWCGQTRSCVVLGVQGRRAFVAESFTFGLVAAAPIAFSADVPGDLEPPTMSEEEAARIAAKLAKQVRMIF